VSNSDKPKSIESTATHVRFFEDRAEVTRKASASVSDGRQWIRLSGATMLLDDRSVQASVNVDSIRVVSARIVREWSTPDNDDEIKGKSKELKSLVRKMNEVQERLGREEDQRDYMHELMSSWTENFAKVPSVDAPITDWENAFNKMQDRDKALLEAWLVEYQKLQELSGQQDTLQSEIDKLRQAPLTFDCFIEVQLDSTIGNEVEIAVTYRTPCALWRPEHMARLHSNEKDPSAGNVQLTTFAAVWQNTGEDWTDVEVSFSTARPAAHASAPDIDDDHLSRRKKTSEEKKQVVVEVREQSVTEVSGGVSEMPGVDDGGVPLEFCGKGKYSLPANGQPTRVEISRHEVKAGVSRELVSERAQVAHIKGTANWPGTVPLLAGPLGVARGASLVGRARIGFVGPGDKLEVGFGPDDGIRARRSVSEDRDKGLTGTQAIEREITLYLSNLSDQAKSVNLLERLPVSEIEGLEVKWKDSKGWTFDAKEGFLTRLVELPPTENIKLKYQYTIKAKSNVVLPF
jgi:uncharacterized protein (TIGR02231 family)